MRCFTNGVFYLKSLVQRFDFPELKVGKEHDEDSTEERQITALLSSANWRKVSS